MIELRSMYQHIREGRGELKPIPGDIGQETGYTLDWSLAHNKADT